MMVALDFVSRHIYMSKNSEVCLRSGACQRATNTTIRFSLLRRYEQNKL